MTSLDPRIVAVHNALAAAVESGEVDGDLATEVLGSVAFWYLGGLHGDDHRKRVWYAQVLRSVGVTVPWEDDRG